MISIDIGLTVNKVRAAKFGVSCVIVASSLAYPVEAQIALCCSIGFPKSNTSILLVGFVWKNRLEAYSALQRQPTCFIQKLIQNTR
ncbi:MAG: hypothetical protein PF904_14760 [Kiritimatiellae bacterium]|nr:hypothetical protein [Kiritimatiellia bacterium]